MELNRITERIIGCALEVHRALGPGLLEEVYESALAVEFELAGLGFERQKQIPVIYRSRQIGLHRLDLVVEDRVVVELKAVERMDAVFQAQVLSYLKVGGYRLGLLINFNTTLLKNGIKRIAL